MCSKVEIRPAWLLAVLALAVSGCALRLPSSRSYPAPEQPEGVRQRIHPARAFDHRPYELIWNEREEEEEALEGFERLLGWEVQARGGAAASIIQTHERQLWGTYVGELTYQSADEHGEVLLRPPEPLRLRDRFDTVQLWVYGDGRGGQRSPLEISVHLEDAAGIRHALPIATVDWDGWWLARRRLNPTHQEAITQPCRLTGLAVRGGGTGAERKLYLDSLAFFTERLPPLDVPAHPRPGVELPGRPLPGYHTGATRLPVPTRADTILPPSASAATPSTPAKEDGAYRFTWTGAQDRVSFTWPSSAGLAGVSVSVDGRDLGRVLSGAGWLPRNGGQGQPVVERREGARVFLQYPDGVSCHLSQRGPSLVVDMSGQGGALASLDLGRLETEAEVERPSLPMFGSGHYRPALYLLRTGPGSPPVFLSVVLDPYRSDASEWVGASNERGWVHGAALYRTRTDGQRNNLNERLVLTASTSLEEVLPALPHPAGREVVRMRDWVWTGFREPGDRFAPAEGPSLASPAYRDLELFHVMARSLWCDAHESFTFREKPAPGRGGEEGLVSLLSHYRRENRRVGLYANYHCLSPLNRHWSVDAIQRLEDGNLKPSSPGTYAVKPFQALAWMNDLLPALRERYAPDFDYVDLHARRPPWESTDYDARIPGAASFAPSYYSFAEMLTRARSEDGRPLVVAEGAQWLYGGLADAHVPAPGEAPVQADEPYLPLYYLTRIHPREAGFGLGRLEDFHPSSNWRLDVDRALSRYMAAQLAYGRGPRLLQPGSGLRSAFRSAYMMLEMHRRYAGQQPARISYWNGTELVNTSQALAAGSHERSQLYVRYEGGLELWVNGHPEETWPVRVGRTEYELPPYGWVAFDDGFFEVSGLAEGRFVEWVDGPAYVYYDGHGSTQPFRGVASPLPVVIQAGEGETVILRPPEDGALAVSREWLGHRPATVKAVGLDGAGLGEVPVVEQDGVYVFELPPETARVVSRPAAGGRE